MIDVLFTQLLRSAVFLALPAALLTACAGPPQSSGAKPDYRALLDAPDRSEADRTQDKKRNAPEFLSFIGPRPGMKVLDFGAGRGYSTELLARSVAPNGVVYAQNSPKLLEAIPAIKERFDERLKSPAMKNVVPVVREFDDPIPPEAKNLDLVTSFFIYHDTVHLGVDRAKMNKAIFNALKPGGVYIVADHSAKPGAGATLTKTLHRIEDSIVRKEVEAAGFQLVDEGKFLHNPNDPREESVFKTAIPNDEFVLKFVKPQG
ncbi:MAG TPA: methyltransferase domain-containing protein [Burkholderiales bacterium]|nr:methyltransferase domain-containing protein [Burkholderiales bacterium]